MTSLKRHPDFPDVPPVADTYPGYEVVSWYGLSAPAATPKPVIDVLAAALRKALANPDAVKALLAAGMEPAASTPEEFGTFIKAEIEKWTKVTRQANITMN